jgi:DNA modification methylase
MSARFIVGDALTVLRSMPSASVDTVVTSSPYWRKRAYLPEDHPEKGKEIGQEDSPAEFLANLLEVADEVWRVLADHGSVFWNLGDSAAFSGGSGGDYLAGGKREEQARYEGTARVSTARGRRGRGHPGRPRPKSVCWIPELFGASLAYGRNLLNGQPCRQWVTRPSVTWCKPNPGVGKILDKFREATELVVFAVKSDQPRGYFFDIDSIRGPSDYDRPNLKGKGSRPGGTPPGQKPNRSDHTSNLMGAPPLNFMVVPPAQYQGAHYATFPEELIAPFVSASCPAKVCLDCGRPVVRLTTGNAIVNYTGGVTERDRQGRGRVAKSDPTDERRTVGWSCGCPLNAARWRSGVVLDPFAGSGTTLAVAVGHGRSAIGIDLDQRNLELARQRVGLFLEVAVAPPVIDIPAGGLL